MAMITLADLEDLIAPPIPGNGPLDWAWGWWALIGLSLLALVSVVIALYRQYRRHQQRWQQASAALAELAQFEPNNANYSNHVSALLKRTFAAYGQRERIAQLHGTTWRAFLMDYAAEPWEELLGNSYAKDPVLLTHAQQQQLHQAATRVIQKIANGEPHA
ncbi:MAG: DUF4381 domain-containing protein [Ferrimonas sp.]